MTVHIGTSGWQYRHWRDSVYPHGLTTHSWLEWYAEHFATVEVNATFYRLPSASVFAEWSARTPSDFVLAVKMSRYLTHVRRLRDPAEPVERFLAHALPLGDKLGPVLVQLPPDLHRDDARLAALLGAWPAHLRLAVEVRHPSWHDPAVADLLARSGAAWCLTDRGEAPEQPLWRTADWGYVRFHGGLGSDGVGYRDVALTEWAERIAERWSPDQDVFAYFNNDPGGAAVRDAVRFAEATRRSGRVPTRVPGRPGRAEHDTGEPGPTRRGPRQPEV